MGGPTALGKLCTRGHDQEGSGMSLRYIHKKRGTATGNCIACGRENGNRDRNQQNKARRMRALDQGRFDEKYRGDACSKGHVLRYVKDGSCVACETERRRDRAKDPDRVLVEKARKDRDNEKRSIERAVDRALKAEGW